MVGVNHSLTQNGCYRAMSTKMSQITRQEVLAKKRDRYARAGKAHKTKIISELVELFGYHRKAAIRALQPRTVSPAPFVLGRPKEYDPDQLRTPLKAIWLAALQPCGVRLKACLPDWLPAYEADHRRLNADVRAALLAASRATLDRLLIPAARRASAAGHHAAGDAPAPPDSHPHGVDGAPGGLPGDGHGGVVWRHAR